MMDKPTRRFALTLTLGADDMDTVRRSLRQMAFDLDGWEDMPYSAVSGGPDVGYTLEIKFDPDVTHESYHEKLSAYLRTDDTA